MTEENDWKIVLSRSNLKTVSLGFALPVGSVGEPVKGITTMLMSHIQRSTAHKSEKQFADHVDDYGISLFSDTDRTDIVMGLTCPPKHVNKGISILNEIMFEPEFKEDTIEKIAQRQTASIQQMQSTPESLLNNYTRWRSAFSDDPITNHPIGTPETIKDVNVEQLVKWHEKIIKNKPYFASVGLENSEQSLNTAGLESFLNSFGDERLKLHPLTNRRRKLAVEVDIPPMDSSNAYIAINVRGTDPRQGLYNEDLYRSLISGGMSARLYTKIREEKNLSYGPRMFNSKFATGSFSSAVMDVRSDRAIEALDTTLELLTDVFRNPIGEGEMDRAIKSAVKVAVFVADSSRSYTNYLLGRLITNQEHDLEVIKKKIVEASKGNWQEHMQNLWTEENVSFSVSGDAGDIDNKWPEAAAKVM